MVLAVFRGDLENRSDSYPFDFMERDIVVCSAIKLG